LKALGNAVVPAVAEHVFRQVMEVWQRDHRLLAA